MTIDVKAYKEQLAGMVDPELSEEQLRVKLDLHGIRDYAKKKGVSIAELSDTERKMFMVFPE